jgi:hypothetical protein
MGLNPNMMRRIGDHVAGDAGQRGQSRLGWAE